MKFTQEQIEKAKAAKSAVEILTLAHEEGIAMTEEEATAYFDEFHKEDELSEEALENVSAGCGQTFSSDTYAELGIHEDYFWQRPSYHPLIVTIGNSCKYRDGTCFKCGKRNLRNGVSYCAARSEEYDPEHDYGFDWVHF